MSFQFSLSKNSATVTRFERERQLGKFPRRGLPHFSLQTEQLVCHCIQFYHKMLFYLDLKILMNVWGLMRGVTYGNALFEEIGIIFV